MEYRLEISRPAWIDAENIYLWLKAGSAERAQEWFRGLFNVIKTLRTFPNRCPIAPESRSFFVEIRQLLYGKGPQQCRIVFGVSVDEQTGGGVVVIYRIRNSSQQFLSDLEIIDESNDD